MGTHKHYGQVDLSDFGGAWSPYTPSVTAGSGTFGSASAAMRYLRIGKTVHWAAQIIITTAGTASGGVQFTLPIAPRGNPVNVGSGRELAATGQLVTVTWTGSACDVMRYDNVSVIASGRYLSLFGTYETA